MPRTASWACRIGGLLLVVSPVFAARPALDEPSTAEQFVQVCTTRLSLDDLQSASLREYLEQEIAYLAVLRANHTPAEVEELIPAEREQLQRVAGRIMSPTQLRRFRELQATPQMQAYLRQMDLK